MTPNIRDSQESDAALLAPTLRTLDLKEIELSSGVPPVEALLNGFRLSDSPKTIALGSEVIGMFGVVQHPDDFGVPWFLSDDRVAQAKLSLLRKAKAWVTEATLHYGLLRNYCLAEHAESLNFIDLLGFTFRPTLVINDVAWVEFIRERS